MAYYISSGTISSGVLLQNDTMTVYSGGTATNTTVNYEGRLYVYSGGTATNTTVNYGGRLYVYSGGTATETTINSGSLYVYSGGTATGTTVNSGYLSVSSGGTATNTTVNSGGDLYVYSGGTATETTVNSGSLDVSSGGTATETTVNSWGRLYVSSGGTATGTTVNSWGSLCVSSGGTATGTTVNSGGDLSVSSGGTATETTVNSGGRLHVYSGGTATNITAASGAILGLTVAPDTYIQGTSAGSAFEIKNGVSGYIVSGGQLDVRSGGTATETTVNSGRLDVRSGGTATETTINSGSTLYVYSGGTALLIKENGGFISVESGADVAFASNTISGIVTYGSMTVHSGTTAIDTTVNGGWFEVFSGGIASNTVVDSGGLFTLNKGAIHKGTLQLSPSGSRYSLSGHEVFGTIDFTISERKTTDGYLINDLFLLDDEATPTYTITVSADQEKGVYKLVQHTASLTATVQSETGTVYGTVSVEIPLEHGLREYTLTLDTEGALTLTIAGKGVRVSSSGSVVSSTDTIKNLYIGSNMQAEIFREGALLSDAAVTRGGVVYVSGGGCAENTTIAQGGRMILSSGSASGAAVEGILTADAYTRIDGMTVENGGIAYLLNMAQAENITVGSRGNLYVGMAGEASEIFLSGGTLHVATGGRVSDVTVGRTGELFLYGGAILDGTVNVSGTVTLEDLTVNNGQVNFVLGPKPASVPMVNDWELLTGGDYTISVDEAVEGSYVLAGNASNFDGTLTVTDASGTLGTLEQNGSVFSSTQEFLLLEQNGFLTVKTYNTGSVYAPEGDAAGVTWRGLPAEDPRYTVAYSRKESPGTLHVETTVKALDTYALGGGEFQWQVSADGTQWISGGTIVSAETDLVRKFVSDSDGDPDLFFAHAAGKWGRGYAAQHQGYGSWEGTGEQVMLTGKNQLSAIFEGSNDASILVLTDDSCGDALFVDDIYSALPDSVTDQQARISSIQEIRAGAGNDVVDLTSSRFAYTGSGVTLRGGDGNDTLWANQGNNILFGDSGSDSLAGGTEDDLLAGGSGDDRMYGGGGDDLFTFGGNWGNDWISQTPEGSVTLWFADGSIDCWDEEKRCYSDGTNSVTVATDTEVNLIFGNLQSAPVAEAFADASMSKIFE